ncbi:MAG: pyridoxal phosphate-dependent aminotransferase [Gemmatimonadetes bacterium]|nr:MAG: pyridoxal phosphate-dependent aminotransferase [Gemmatimonadota bacterium]
MPYSENIARLQPSATIAVSSLAKRLRAEGRDIVDLSAGEPDFDTPEFIVDAAIDGLRRGRTRYTPAPGLPELRRAIAESLAEWSGRDVDWEGVVVSAGAKQSLFNACFSLFGPGDEVLIVAPYWTSYPQIVALTRAEPVFVAGDVANGFKADPDRLEAARTPRTRGLILCSPCNPTGAVYSRDELDAVARWAERHGVCVVADEIYRSIYYGAEGGRAPSILDLDEDALSRWVLIDGASKAFAMTGWRIGFSYTATDLARKISALQSHTTSNAATPSQVAALAAFAGGARTAEAVAGMVDAFRRRRNAVTGWMRERLPGVDFVEPGGAFYLFFRVDGFFDAERPDSSAFCSWLIETAGVATVPGVAFGDDRYARMSFAAADETLDRGIERMAEAVRSLSAASGAPTS